MFVLIEYGNYIDDYKFQLWLSHYITLGLDFKIFVRLQDFKTLADKYPNFVERVIHVIPDDTNFVVLTEDDFLFAFYKNPNDVMVLHKNISMDELQTAGCIGRVFHVPVEGKPNYTTFEIPDYILYSHYKHTNYTTDGIIVNKNYKHSTLELQHISKRIVCICLKETKVVDKYDYYETNILTGEQHDSHVYFKNVYNMFNMNVLVNKEKLYGIIWNSKCACTSISTIFCKLNNIDLPPHYKRSINFHIENKHYYNAYLQNVQFISFVRNPYYRFLSVFIDKHVYKTDDVYVILDGYTKYINKYDKDTIYNLCKSILNNDDLISLHFSQIQNQPMFLRNNINCKIYKMEDGFNIILYNFLVKFYPPDLLFSIGVLTHKENTNKPVLLDGVIVNPKLKYYDRDEWIEYLKTNILNYDTILDDELKQMICTFFFQDFTYNDFNYSK